MTHETNPNVNHIPNYDKPIDLHEHLEHLLHSTQVMDEGGFARGYYEAISDVQKFLKGSH